MKRTDAEHLLRSMDGIDDTYIQEALRPRPRLRLARLLPLVAVAALLVALGTAATAENWLGLRGLLLSSAAGGSSAIESAAETPDAEAESKAVNHFSVDMGTSISLAGCAETPEARAAGEWHRFLAGYDTDGALLEALGNGPTGLPARYSEYYVYTQEMADTLDEIVARYGLRLHSEINVVFGEELCRRVGGQFVRNVVGPWSGYIYEDGSFSCDIDLAPDGMAPVEAQMRRAVRGTFDEVTLNIGDVASYEETVYTTESGHTVLLALNDFKGILVADLPACFVVMNVLEGRSDGLTCEDLSRLAECLDLNVLAAVVAPEMAGDSIPEAADLDDKDDETARLERILYTVLMRPIQPQDDRSDRPAAAEQARELVDWWAADSTLTAWEVERVVLDLAAELSPEARQTMAVQAERVRRMWRYLMYDTAPDDPEKCALMQFVEFASLPEVNSPEAQRVEVLLMTCQGMNAYLPLLNTLCSAIAGNWTAENRRAAGVDCTLDPLFAQNPLEAVGYEFWDLDGNGTEELLLVATNQETDDKRIVAAWTLKNGAPALLWSGEVHYICEEGRLLWYDADAQLWQMGRLKQNGSLQAEELLWLADGQEPRCKNTPAEDWAVLSDEAAQEWLNMRRRRVILPESTPLVHIGG